MKAIVLDYSDARVDVMHIPDECEHTEEVELYLMNKGYKLSNIYWMSVPDDTHISVCDADNHGELLFNL